MVINAVGLTRSLIGPHTPRLSQFLQSGQSASIATVIPAVTCSVQATYLTGTWPHEHAIVGNGWYFRDTCEVRFWHQSDRLVQRPRIWSIARSIDASFTCANCFWWHAMYSDADFTITPRPMYAADGRKLPDVWTHPPELRDSLQATLGQFPLFKFWGPAADITSTRWIVSAALEVERRFQPTLNLIYLPHLDYALQKFGPNAKEINSALSELDAEVGRLLDDAATNEISVVILSEYGIAQVDNPVHLNRVLRTAGLVSIRTENGRELLDTGASRAFAVADHQVAHVYVNDPDALQQVRTLLEQADGVDGVFDKHQQRDLHLAHERSGDFVVTAKPGSWFTYYFWFEDSKAPDFARTVDIHRKPGYDPAELFLDPLIPFPKARIAGKLLARKLGSRSLLDVIPLDASLVRGSHGIAPATPDEGPLLMSNLAGMLQNTAIDPTDVCGIILKHLQSG